METSTAPTEPRRRPFGGRRKLVNAVDVRFTGTMTVHAFDAGELLVRRGDKLVVDTPRGPMIGLASGLVERRVLATQDLRRVIRRADEHDLAAWDECEKLRERAMRVSAEEVRRNRLPMKVVQAEYTLDRSRALVYFTSEEKPEFRTIARTIAQRLNVRVDLRTIGMREGTGLIGGIGPCGHELCCATFLRHFGSISLRYAKDQGLTLNPGRVAGMCGRLKCCLVYEQPVYKDLKRFAPRPKLGVLTPQGPGNILDVDPLARTVFVSLGAGVLAHIPIRDCVVMDRPMSRDEIDAGLSREDEVLLKRRQRRGGVQGERRPGAARPAADLGGDGYLWEGASADAESLTVDGRSASGAAEGDAGTTKRRRRKKPGAGGPDRDAGGAQARAQQPQPGAPKGDGTSSAKKRRRRKKPGAGAGAGAGGNAPRAPENRPPGGGAPGGPSVQRADAAPGAEGEAARKKRRRRRRKPGGEGTGGGGGGEGGGGDAGGSGGE